MALWVEVYGRKRTDCSKLLKEQAEDMANVFLELCFNDLTKEAVVVPMVKKDNLWLMK